MLVLQYSSGELSSIEFNSDTIHIIKSYTSPIRFFDIAEDKETIGILVNDEIEFSSLAMLPEVDRSFQSPLMNSFAIDPMSTYFVFNNDRRLVIANIIDFEIKFELTDEFAEIKHYSYMDLSEFFINEVIILAPVIFLLEIIIKSRMEKKVISDIEKTDMNINLYPE